MCHILSHACTCTNTDPRCNNTYQYIVEIFHTRTAIDEYQCPTSGVALYKEIPCTEISDVLGGVHWFCGHDIDDETCTATAEPSSPDANRPRLTDYPGNWQITSISLRMAELEIWRTVLRGDGLWIDELGQMRAEPAYLPEEYESEMSE